MTSGAHDPLAAHIAADPYLTETQARDLRAVLALFRDNGGGPGPDGFPGNPDLPQLASSNRVARCGAGGGVRRRCQGADKPVLVAAGPQAPKPCSSCGSVWCMCGRR